MKKKNLGISLTATALTFAMLLSACSSPGGKDEGKAAQEQKPPASAEKPVLKYLGPFSSGIDVNTDPGAKLVEKVTGYKVDYAMLPAERADEKLNLEMASGAYYDILSVNKQQFMGLVNQNSILPLDDLLAKHGPNILKAIDNKVFGVTTVNGKKYGLPYISNYEYISWAMAVRQDILDQLGLKVPTTPDEFYTTLKTIKEKTNMIPLVADSGFIETIASAFGLSTAWKDVNGNLVPLVKQDGMQPYLEYMSKLYKEGLIDKDLPVSKLDNAREKFVSGKAVFMRFGWGNRLPELVVPEIEKNFPGGKVAIVSPLKDKNGKSEVMVDRGAGRITVVTKVSKYPEDAIKYMDKKLEEANHKFLGIGTEGVEHKFENGKYFPILPKFNEERGNMYWYFDAVDTKKWSDYWLARNQKNPFNYQIFIRMLEDKATAGKFDPTAYAPPSEATVKYTSTLDVLVKDYYIKVVAGAESLANFNKFIASWESSGGKDVEKAFNDWYRSTPK